MPTPVRFAFPAQQHRSGMLHKVLGGGWAVDALLGEQTREHSDLDLWLPAADVWPGAGIS